MKWREPVRREYYAKYERMEIANDQGWYECYRLPGNVLAICEPQHLQEVNAFLIPGNDRALLIDTGSGMADIRKVVDELWQGPLTVVNTHFHFDHVGGNALFDEVLVSANPLVERQAREGIPHDPLANQCDPDMFLFDYPQGFDPETFHVKPYRVRSVADGTVVDLGGRAVELLHTPGHTQDSMMVYDADAGILFGGDMLYYGAIYAQFNNDFMGYSDIDAYLASLRRVTEHCTNLQAVYASHNDFVMPPRVLDDVRHAFYTIREKMAHFEPMDDPSWAYYGDVLPLRRCWFDGFSVIIR